MNAATSIDDDALDSVSEEEVLRGTLRVNTLILGLVFGLVTSVALLLVSILANFGDWHGGLVVGLLAVFLPGYGRDVSGALFGVLWGFAIGGALGALVYRLNTLHVLRTLDTSVITDEADDEFPAAVLRLSAPALGVAIGATGALGLVVTTNLLVLRGTAGESVHASLLSEILPGYRVSPIGSLVGAVELFVVLYVFCALFVAVYNGVAAWHRRRAMARLSRR